MPFDKKLPRREFLRISSVVVAGTAAASFIDGTPLLAAVTAPASASLPLLSVGYVEKVPENGVSARLRYAGDLTSGDPGFLKRSAQIVISSYARNAKFRGQDGGFEVDAIFPAHSYTPEKYPRFRAWLALEHKGTESASSGSRFVLPVTSTEGAQLVVRRLRVGIEAAAKNDEALLPLSLGVESGTLKLQRGVYVVAFREAPGEEVPNWYNLSIASANGVLSIPNATFSYVMITVDYAQ